MQTALFETAPETAPAVPGYPCAFSPDRVYRYVLWRVWANHASPRYCAFIGLNPSTADETTDDPTIRRCIGFAKAWGYDALAMLNLFAYRATYPADMKAESDPVGDDNDVWLARIAAEAGVVIAAWGNHGAHLNRAAAVRVLLPNLHCLRLTKAGQPEHPLYLPAALEPMDWSRERVIDLTPNGGDCDG
jgi:hypothetical protein